MGVTSPREALIKSYREIIAGFTFARLIAHEYADPNQLCRP